MLRESIEALLQGEFICNITNPKCFDFLENEDNFNEANNILTSLGREIKVTNNKTAYYAVWTDVNEIEQKAIRNEFINLRDQIRPIIEFILLCMDCSLRDHPLAVGDEIKQSFIQEKVQNDNSLASRVSRIYQSIIKRKSSDPIPIQLKAIFDFMKKSNIVYEHVKDSQIFQITGKIDYIYEVLNFMDSHDQILSQSEAAHNQQAIQGDIFDGFC